MKYFRKAIILFFLYILLTAQTPYEGEAKEILLSPEEKELNELANKLTQLDDVSELEKLEKAKSIVEQGIEEAKQHEPKINQIHKSFQKIKLQFKSLKEECDFSECKNIIRYKITNNSNYKITNISYKITIKNNGKTIYSSAFYKKYEKAILPGAEYNSNGGFDDDDEMYDMVIPKSASISLTLTGVQLDFKDWVEDQYEEFNQGMKMLIAKQKEINNAIKQYHKTTDMRREEITKRIAQLRQQESSHVSFEQ